MKLREEGSKTEKLMTNKTIKQQLLELAEPDYQKFAAALVPNVSGMLGVRLPLLRKLAKDIAKGDWRSYLAATDSEYFEEIMLQGMVIGSAKADLQELLTYVELFVPKIDSWSICDSFCAGLKFTNRHKEQVWQFLQPYLKSNKEFELRFGIVMLLDFYIVEEYIERVLGLFDEVNHEGYYVKMALAWAISICYIKFPELTLDYLQKSKLDDFTYNKALQKIIESRRVDQEAKELMRKMKRK